MSYLRTRHVMLDTTEFDAANHVYASGALAALIEVAENGSAHVYLTDVVLREVSAHVSKGVSESLAAQRAFESKARILRNSVIPSVRVRFEQLDGPAIEAELLKQLDGFVKRGRVHIIAVGDVSAATVFEMYFGKKAPFGEGKTKAEFPDAFTVAAAHGWAKAQSKVLYLVSGDEAVRSACDGVHVVALEKLSSFLDLVALEDEAKAAEVHRLLEARFGEVVERIGKEFEEQGFDVPATEGEVTSVAVQHIELLDVDILSYKPRAAQVELQVRVQFMAQISYPDLDHASYDSEEKRLIVWDTIEKEVESEEIVRVSATVLLDPDDPNVFAFQGVNILGPNTYTIEAEDDGWPYK